VKHQSFDVVVIGGGAGGIAAASSLLKRRPSLDIAIVEPSALHRYQPGQTLVGGGIFQPEQTARPMAACIPKRAHWLHARVSDIDAERDRVTLEGGTTLGYETLVAAPGIELDWSAIDGLEECLGRYGVTSNYAAEHAPYTWRLVSGLEAGRAVFTQPPMPIKCAGAPQKAVYLSCNAWERRGVLDRIDVSFHNAGAVLFGVADYVPALEQYMDRYGVERHFKENLVAVDGPAGKAYLDGEGGRRVVDFDLLHVCPRQTTPAFVRDSALVNDAGWIEVDDLSLQHRRFPNVFALGDAASTPNAKTAAAIRKQAPVVAENLLAHVDGKASTAAYDGYGSCPLTVERGKVVLAEFGYGGKLLPTVPRWLNDGTRPTAFGWQLKASWLPWIYFDMMLKGREWLAAPGQA